jgi:hypothetical protein
MWLGYTAAALLLHSFATHAATFDFTAIPESASTIAGWQATPNGAFPLLTSGLTSDETAIYLAQNTSLTATLSQAKQSAITAPSSAGLSVAMQFRIDSPSDKPITIASIAGITLMLQPAQFLLEDTKILFKDDFAAVRQGSMM